MKFRIRPAVMTCDVCAALSATEECPASCERRFVLSGWSSSFKGSDEAGMITTDDFPHVMHAQIAKITARPECRVLLALDQTFLGFIAGEPEARIVYYCYVKSTYRRRGFARRLFAALGVDPAKPFTFPARTFWTFQLRSKIPMATRDVNVARYPREQRTKDRRTA